MAWLNLQIAIREQHKNKHPASAPQSAGSERNGAEKVGYHTCIQGRVLNDVSFGCQLRIDLHVGLLVVIFISEPR